MKIDFACPVIIFIWVNGVTDALLTQSCESLTAPSDRVSPHQQNDLDLDVMVLRIVLGNTLYLNYRALVWHHFNSARLRPPKLIHPP